MPREGMPVNKKTCVPPVGEDFIEFEPIRQEPCPGIFSWLMEGDASIRYQTLRDLAPPGAYTSGGIAVRRREVAATRSLIALEGWGRRFMEERDASTGLWGGGVYGPKWISTHYTLLDLKTIGIDPGSPSCAEALRESALLLLDRGFWTDCGINFGITVTVSDVCVTGMVLGMLAYFGVHDQRLERIFTYLLDRQLPDGGWNCAWSMGSEHYSVHTTISVLEGLADYAASERANADILDRAETAARRGRECLLAHRLFRSLRDGEPIAPALTMLSFPCRWYYDILRALDHFQAVGAPYDPRMEDALGILRGKRRKDGTWPSQNRHQGRTHFEMEKAGEPSRWNTLRAMRVLAAYGEEP
jgi:hypothetical protein